MKKYGKYEKRPVVVAEKPKTNSILLQTYLTSLLCMVLCVTMFFGTSYAWFTSEVNNVENEIYVGTLKVGLYKQDGIDLSKGDNTLFDGHIRWEPGYTSLETIEIVNEGDLAFKYVLSLTDGNVTKGEAKAEMNLADVAKYFDVWVFNHRDNTYLVPGSYAEIAKEGSNWVNVGTLDRVLAGEPVLNGERMVTVRKDGQEAAAINEGTTDGVATKDTYTLALHMKEEATADVMGHKISLNVKLVAYQMASEQEKDGLGGGYDNITIASDATQLKANLASGGNTVLASGIKIENESDRVTMNGGVLDGNGEKITYSGGRDGGSSVGVVTTTGGTVRNLIIDGGEDGRALYITKLTSDLFVSDCTFSGAYAFNLNSVEPKNYTINFTNVEFKNWTSYANVMEHAYFTGCTFEDVLKPYGDTTLTNCNLKNEELDVSALEEGETITLVNCTYKGVVIEKAMLTVKDGAVSITGSGVLDLNDDKVVVVK